MTNHIETRVSAALHELSDQIGHGPPPRLPEVQVVRITRRRARDRRRPLLLAAGGVVVASLVVAVYAPDRDPADPPAAATSDLAACAELGLATKWPPRDPLPGLDIDVLDPPATIPTTGTELRVQLTKTGDQLIEFGSGTATAIIFDTDGSVVGGGQEVLQFGIWVRLAPGESMDLPLKVAPTSCTDYPAPLAPGAYELRALVQHTDGDATTLASASSYPFELTP